MFINNKPNLARGSAGFALIYAMLFVMLAAITVIAVSASSFADMGRTVAKVNSAGAWQLAQAGLESGIADYQAGNKDCALSIENWIDNSDHNKGSFKYKVCDNNNDKYIIGIGYYYENKVGLKAELKNDGSVEKVYQIASE